MDGEFEPEFEDAEEENLFRLATLGAETENFFHSPLGRHVLGLAAADLADVKDACISTSPRWGFGRRKLIKEQQKAQAIRLAIEWLRDALDTGRQAEQALIQYRQE